MEIFMPPKEVMTIQQIKDAYMSNDYGAELLLKHLLIRTAELEEVLKEQRLETDAWRGTAKDKGASSRSAAAERDALKARVSELEAPLRDALGSFKCTQRVLSYPESHWSRRACALLNEEPEQPGHITFTRP